MGVAIQILLLFILPWRPAQAATVQATLVVPSELSADVGFWEAVFSRFSPDQCVFHDRDRLNTVYFAKRLPGNDPRQQARAVARYSAAIRRAFAYLAEGGAPRNLLEKRLRHLVPEIERNSEGYRAAAEALRCQRGVDLKPAFERANRYLPMVRRIFRRAGLPGDLAYLPFLESGYHPQARSKAGALGIWQLMPATARLSGLTVSRRRDDRRSPEQATRAAARILRDYYDRTGSWPLAVTAYNYGINGVRRAIDKYGVDYLAIRERHQTSLFGFAARNYFPSFVAVRNVVVGDSGQAAPAEGAEE